MVTLQRTEMGCDVGKPTVMKWRYLLLSLLVLSVIANAIFIPSYFNLRRSSHEVSSIDTSVGAAVHDANINLQKYNETHSDAALVVSEMQLLNASGQLEQYSAITTDGTAGKFGFMLGNLGAGIVLRKNVDRDSQIVNRIASQLPDTKATIAKFEGSQTQLDNVLETILKQFPPSQYNLY